MVTPYAEGMMVASFIQVDKRCRKGATELKGWSVPPRYAVECLWFYSPLYEPPMLPPLAPTGRLVIYPAGKTHKLGKSNTNRVTCKSSRQTRRESVYCHIPATTSNHPDPRGRPPAGSTTT